MPPSRSSPSGQVIEYIPGMFPFTVYYIRLVFWHIRYQLIRFSPLIRIILLGHRPSHICYVL